MNGFYVIFTLWISIQMIGLVGGCSVQDHDFVDYAFLSCRNNDTCEAQCYQGFVFPTGKTKSNYSCLDGPSSEESSCKRIPTVIIEYLATWRSNNVLPSKCDNFSTLQTESEKMLREIRNLCNTLAIDVNVTFTYSTLAFMVNAAFVIEYDNYTSATVLETCESLYLGQLKNHTMPYIESRFDSIKCGNETINHTLWNDTYINGSQFVCPIGTEVKNITVTQAQHDEDRYEYFCGDRLETTDSDVETSSQIFTTLVNSTSINDGSRTESIDIPSKTTESVWEASSQKFTTLENSTFINGNLTTESISNNFERKTLYYGAGLAAGILVLLSLITLIVALCRTQSFKTAEVHLQDNEMTELERSYGTSFKGILIENEFYQSADNVPIVSNDTGDYSTALPYYKAESETTLTSDENHYSYATSSRQIDVSCDVSKNGTNMTSDKNHYSYANSTLYAVAEICNDAVKEETKEEQISEENAVEEPIEMNEVVRDSC